MPSRDRLARLRGFVDRGADRVREVQRRAPRLIGALRVAYYPLALAIVAYFAVDVVRKVDLARLDYLPLAFSYLFALAWWLSLALGWSALITERYEFTPVANWARTQVPRYLPGGIWAPLARATTVKGRIRHRVAAVFAENATSFFVALGVGALWAGVHQPLFLPGALLVVVPLLGSGWLERHSKVTRRAVLRASATYAVGFVCYGISGLLAQISFSGLHRPTYPLYVAGATCVAWAIGLVVVFAPGGVGVREVVYVWMLSGLTYTSAELKGAAISSRLVSIFAELTVLAVVTRPRLQRHADRREAAREATRAQQIREAEPAQLS